MAGPIRHLRVAVLVVTALAATGAGHGAAQELSGVALGPDGGPLVDWTVVLHRVGGGGGAFVATDTTGTAGEFRFALESADSAIYFAALSFEDRMYIGPAVQGGTEPVTGYVLRVEPGSEAGAVASALGDPRPARPTTSAGPATARSGAVDSDMGAVVLVGLLALAAVTVFIVAAPRYRQRRRADALIELATVENALTEPANVEERTRLETARDRLRKQLAPRN